MKHGVLAAGCYQAYHAANLWLAVWLSVAAAVAQKAATS